ncbi:MAG TPA: PmoA family protein [Micromonosporaceae bacterium]|nr:PmoA family protein [Micromonosporaceae bacterium]
MPRARLVHDLGYALSLHYGPTELVRYVYQPTDAQVESPRPYFHPMRTLAGDLVSLYRPHDHVWHKGLAWSLPNVGAENFWGGPIYLREGGYQQRSNNGAMRHDGFDRVELHDGQVTVEERLTWVTEAGEAWFAEARSMRIAVEPDAGAWVLLFGTHLVNQSGHDVVFGSPTTQGRPNAGYGGLFWRGPRSFTGGSVHTPAGAGGDELMGVREPWLAFSGRHDDHGRQSTVVMVDAATNAGHPTKWFVRSTPFACFCPAPFFDTEVTLAPGAELALRYAVVVADGGPDGVQRWAKLGTEALAVW